MKTLNPLDYDSITEYTSRLVADIDKQTHEGKKFNHFKDPLYATLVTAHSTWYRAHLFELARSQGIELEIIKKREVEDAHSKEE